MFVCVNELNFTIARGYNSPYLTALSLRWHYPDQVRTTFFKAVLGIFSAFICVVEQQGTPI